MCSKSSKQKTSLINSKTEEEDLELEEIEITQKRTFTDRIYEIAEKFASTNIGQYLTERADRTLKVIEDTAKWSLPQDTTECNLERPVPWLPFLTLIVILRLLRVWLSLGAMLVGKGTITPHQMVYFIQTRRRKLRAIRVHGAKAIRQREIEVVTYKTSTSSETSLMYNLRNLLSTAICRPGQQRETERPIFMKQGGIYEENSSNDRQTSKRPRDDSGNEHNLTIDQMLAKYANEDSDDDSDFIPNPEEVDTDEDGSTSSASDSSDATDEESNAETLTTEDTNLNTNKGKGKENSVEILENGIQKAAMPKPMQEIKREPYSDVDSVNEETETSKLKQIMSNGNDKHNETATTMANNNLGLSNGIGEKEKSTLGQQTAAVTKPVTLNATATAVATNNTVHNIESIHPNTCKSLSLSILANPIVNFANEVPRKSNPSLPNLNDTNDMSGVSSDEDIFYSPIGSPSNFNACFSSLPNTSSNKTTNSATSASTIIDENTARVDGCDSSSSSSSASAQTSTTSQPMPQKQQHYYSNQRYRGKNRRY